MGPWSLGHAVTGGSTVYVGRRDICEHRGEATERARYAGRDRIGLDTGVAAGSVGEDGGLGRHGGRHPEKR